MLLRTTQSTRSSVFSAVLLGAALLTGCGSDEPAERIEYGGNAGIDEEISSAVKITDVELVYQAGGYQPGDDVDLRMAITNIGTTPVTLTEVTTEAASGVSGDLPISVPSNDNVYIGYDEESQITLTGLEQGLDSGQSIPVTFTFGDLGEVTEQVPVAADPPGSGGTDPSDPVGIPSGDG